MLIYLDLINKVVLRIIQHVVKDTKLFLNILQIFVNN